jgi:Fe2+ transport system protein FeoA
MCPPPKALDRSLWESIFESEFGCAAAAVVRACAPALPRVRIAACGIVQGHTCRVLHRVELTPHVWRVWGVACAVRSRAR